MALIHVNFKPRCFDIDTPFIAIIPDGCIGMENNIRTVYLLHGLSDDNTCWSRYTSIEEYARNRGIAVIMPNGGRSFYTDMAHGLKYNTYITRELLQFSRRLFRLSQRREDTFLMGQSMGGYGAFKLALQNPDIYGAAVSLSGVMDASAHFGDDGWKGEGDLIFNDRHNIKGTDNDLFALTERIASNANKPRLLSVCGTSDFLYQENIKYRDFMSDKNYDFTYKEAPGSHTWKFWDSFAAECLDFLLATK